MGKIVQLNPAVAFLGGSNDKKPVLAVLVNGSGQRHGPDEYTELVRSIAVKMRRTVHFIRITCGSDEAIFFYTRRLNSGYYDQVWFVGELADYHTDHILDAASLRWRCFVGNYTKADSPAHKVIAAYLAVHPNRRVNEATQ